MKQTIPVEVEAGEGLCGYSCNGANLWGDKASIKAAMEAFHSHGQIDDLKRNLRHWMEECGKLHARVTVLEAEIQRWSKRAHGLAGVSDEYEVLVRLSEFRRARAVLNAPKGEQG